MPARVVNQRVIRDPVAEQEKMAALLVASGVTAETEWAELQAVAGVLHRRDLSPA